MRPEYLTGTTARIRTGCGYLYITLNYVNNKPYEIFLTLGKAGRCAAAQMDAIAKLLTEMLQNNINIIPALKLLRHTECEKKYMCEGGGITSCADGIAKILLKMIGDE